VDAQTRRIADLPRLQKFLGPAKDDFRPNAAEPLGWVEWIVREQLPEGGARPARARRAPVTQVPERAPDPFAKVET